MQGLHHQGEQEKDEGWGRQSDCATRTLGTARAGDCIGVCWLSIAARSDSSLCLTVTAALWSTPFCAVQLKHVPVHLRKRSLHEQTEKASRILAEEMEGRAEEAGDDEHGYVSAARGPLLVGSNGRTAESDEQVKLSDILELALELLELVETHVGRCGTLEDVARFENQLKVRAEEHAACTRGSLSVLLVQLRGPPSHCRIRTSVPPITL